MQGKDGAIMALEKELQYYNEHKEELLRNHEGKFALIKGDQLLGTFDTDEAAFEAGVARLGNEPMLIKQISREDRIDQVPALVCGWCHA